MTKAPLSDEDEVLLRMLKTPPKHHADMKIGKKKKPSRATTAATKAGRPTDSRGQ
jgi:hypothetical protein